MGCWSEKAEQAASSSMLQEGMSSAGSHGGTTGKKGEVGSLVRCDQT